MLPFNLMAYAFAMLMVSWRLTSFHAEGIGDMHVVTRSVDVYDPELHFKDSELVPPLQSWELRKLHSGMDLDSDGKVTVYELHKFSAEQRRNLLTKHLDTVYTVYDRDKDGKISELEAVAFEAVTHDHEPPELNRRRVELEKAKFCAADDTKDGFLDIMEMVSFLYPDTNEKTMRVLSRETLNAKDRNGDGLLTPDEFLFESPREGHRLSSPPGGIPDVQDFRNLDVNQDGHLSVDELESFESGRLHDARVLDVLFSAADKDEDGLLAAAELDGAKEKIIATEAHWLLHHWAMTMEFRQEEQF